MTHLKSLQLTLHFVSSTIWHELIFGFLPFEGQPAELVIWQVGKGMKQSLINLQASKEIKVSSSSRFWSPDHWTSLNFKEEALKI